MGSIFILLKPYPPEAKLVPVLDEAVPATRCNFACLEGVPLGSHAHPIVALHLPEGPARLPVPEEAPPFAVPGNEKPPVGRKVQLACVPRGIVPSEDALSVHPELVPDCENAHRVVQRLAHEVRAGRVDRHRGHRVHRRVRDVLDLHGNAKVPHPQGLVVAAGHETPVLIHKGDRVDGAQVLVVLLDDVARLRVELVNLLVR
mmetsp:Transcript_14081/g.36317  ORF Transcript_14081/g.36317 Transcript_14081/m.36317 type:complete len:202 (-) Transcript_14081:496-1101(-)